MVLLGGAIEETALPVYDFRAKRRRVESRRAAVAARIKKPKTIPKTPKMLHLLTLLFLFLPLTSPYTPSPYPPPSTFLTSSSEKSLSQSSPYNITARDILLENNLRLIPWFTRHYPESVREDVLSTASLGES